ncbi:MAG: polysaccharide deacetylase [Hungatella sp.]|nr:polysaccharide deacetylase [Hungatella sp.]
MKPYNSQKAYHHRQAQRRKRRLQQKLPIIFLSILLILVLGSGFIIIKNQLKGQKHRSGTSMAGSQENQETQAPQPGTEAGEPVIQESGEETSAAISIDLTSEVDGILVEAEKAALCYDYDRAIELLQNSGYLGTDPEVDQAVAQYEEIRNSLKPFDLNKITHVFFHTLVMDESKAFDGDEDEKGYNQVMTTRDEFLKILQSMYDRGFVLVRLHDIAHEVIGEDGTARMERGTILLPEGKQPFVMSQDDVCYYDYMEGDGFAYRMVIGEDGKPTCQMKMDDGSISTGSYDLVPILEDFIQEHPDFSYKGARAVIAFTGYQGILGYRTAASYSTSPTFDQDCQDAAAVAQCLRDNGWELASHSWGHRDLGNIEYEKFIADSNKWENEVKSLIGPTDIILFPFGADVGDWHPYTHENKRFQYLWDLGFRYFCNVDSNQYWIQFGTDFMRQGRRNLDGFRMWQDIVAGTDTTGNSKRRLDDLFRAEDVFSPNRPTPVLWE